MSTNHRLVGKRNPRLNWQPITVRAADIVNGYDTPVTLRQLFYRLLSEGLIRNTKHDYQSLSDRTAKARRDGWFPDLHDAQRRIHRALHFDGPDEAMDWLRDVYRRDRTEGQPVSLYLGIEKNALLAQVSDWFEDFGIPVVAMGGYASQTLVDRVRRDVEANQRPAVLIYAGDLDPWGEDIDADFLRRAGCFDSIERIALSEEQMVEHALPPNRIDHKFDAKHSIPAVERFRSRHGDVFQVELDALDPDVLRDLYADAVARHWDGDAYKSAIERESADREAL